METDPLRILVACEPWFGSTGWAVMASLRRLGHEVEVVNYREVIPKVTTTRLKVLRRLLRRWFVGDYNRYVLRQADRFEPDVFLAVKGARLLPETLRTMSRRGIRTYNYYPDVSFLGHDPYIPQTLDAYDHVFTTKSFHVAPPASPDGQRAAGELVRRLGPDRASFLPHGYMPEVHRPMRLTARDRQRYEVAVSFIGMHSPKKQRLIATLRRALPDVGIRIWGNLWDRRCTAEELRPAVQGRWITGWDYAKAIQAARINLAINSEPVPGSAFGDFMSRRSFEIPACGGFMLHERNDEIRRFYREDREVALFGDGDELAEKVRYWLDHPDQRQAVAQAGRARCVPAYSYDQRMRELLSVDRVLASKGRAA